MFCSMRTGRARSRDVRGGLHNTGLMWIFVHYSDVAQDGGNPFITRTCDGRRNAFARVDRGVLDYYHLTGKREAREKAISIADNMIRHLESPKFSRAGGQQARETGWAMRGLIAVYIETREEKYLDACRRIAEQFIEWKEKWGALLAPYTAHTLVRVPFMISIAINALHRYYTATGDDRIPSLIVEEMGDLLDHCVMPDGRFFYKELPSLPAAGGGSSRNGSTVPWRMNTRAINAFWSRPSA